MNIEQEQFTMIRVIIINVNFLNNFHYYFKIDYYSFSMKFFLKRFKMIKFAKFHDMFFGYKM